MRASLVPPHPYTHAFNDTTAKCQIVKQARQVGMLYLFPVQILVPAIGSQGYKHTQHHDDQLADEIGEIKFQVTPAHNHQETLFVAKQVLFIIFLPGRTPWRGPIRCHRLYHFIDISHKSRVRGDSQSIPYAMEILGLGEVGKQDGVGIAKLVLIDKTLFIHLVGHIAMTCGLNAIGTHLHLFHRAQGLPTMGLVEKLRQLR